MTDYPEYTVTRPPNCPAKWDHLREREFDGSLMFQRKCGTGCLGMLV